MFNTNAELLNAIRLGEDSRLELKRVVFAGNKIRGPERDQIADELAAMANAKGGVVILGVDDKSREILGIPYERLDLAEDFIREIVQDSLDPPLLVDIRREELPDDLGQMRAILRVDIDRSLFVHSSRGRYFYRVGSSKRPIPPEFLARLMQQRSQARLIRFDEQVVHRASLDALDAELTGRYRTPRSDEDETTFLRKIAMANEDSEGILRPTVSGILLGTWSPSDYLTNAFIQAVAYRGNAGEAFDELRGYQLDQQDIVGPLDVQVEEACRFVARNMKVAGSKDAGRSDQPQFDLTAVFEALVNAVAHRDYSMYGSKIRLRLYNDCLQIFVPGSLANSMNVGTLPMRQATRNEAITSLLARTPVKLSLTGFTSNRDFMMDRRGEGVNLILERSFRLSGRMPVYELINDSELQLTIFGADIVIGRKDE